MAGEPLDNEWVEIFKRRILEHLDRLRDDYDYFHHRGEFDEGWRQIVEGEFGIELPRDDDTPESPENSQP